VNILLWFVHLSVNQSGTRSKLTQIIMSTLIPYSQYSHCCDMFHPYLAVALRNTHYDVELQWCLKNSWVSSSYNGASVHSTNDWRRQFPMKFNNARSLNINVAIIKDWSSHSSTYKTRQGKHSHTWNTLKEKHRFMRSWRNHLLLFSFLNVTASCIPHCLCIIYRKLYICLINDS
jgi:hypothetical protein